MLFILLLTVLQKNQWFSLMPFFTTDHHCELFAWNIESAQRKLLKTPIVQSMHYITSNYNNMVLNGTFTHVVVLFLIYPSLPHWRRIEKSLLLIQDTCTCPFCAPNKLSPWIVVSAPSQELCWLSHHSRFYIVYTILKVLSTGCSKQKCQSWALQKFEKQTILLWRPCR